MPAELEQPLGGGGEGGGGVGGAGGGEGCGPGGGGPGGGGPGGGDGVTHRGYHGEPPVQVVPGQQLPAGG